MLSSHERLLRNLDWNLLYTFLTIVDEKSITGAARKLSLSQPSVSNALKRLESHLGVQLITRRKGVFTLTYQGLRVYEFAASTRRVLTDMAEQFSQNESEIQGEIDIQIASHIHCPAFDQTLARFHQLYPNVLITINTQPSAEIVRAVGDGELHIGLSNKKVSQTGLCFDLLGYERMGFYCGRSHPLFGRETLEPEALSGLSYVSFESDQPGEGLSAIAQLRTQLPFWGKLVAVSSNEEEIRRLILAGVGFGSLTVEGAKPFVELGHLWQLPPYDRLPTAAVYLVTPETTPLTDVEKRFLAMLRKAVSLNVEQVYFDEPESGVTGSENT
ncbi:LysR family transcriptional regulator [Photobacterium sp. TY1-4]|uniref:LysR family transcriptional regulator n=1 Tax=Photobacterium sp. TY1-4 TaxID=2899122 RepID=UPI0021C1F562|nr:LysR family transcriptional regulator [Photobacterium sp. TY1-4]UXI03725.1 LysR family transcriptional regulator [Photobacterium sp. TY1-4]